MRRLLLIPLLLLLAVPAAALARGNPADALLHLPIEASTYDKATHCSSKARPGVEKLIAWLGENVRGALQRDGGAGSVGRLLDLGLVGIGRTEIGDCCNHDENIGRRSQVQHRLVQIVRRADLDDVDPSR